MKISRLLVALACIAPTLLTAQTNWPHSITPAERNHVERMGFPKPVSDRGIETPPPYENLRTAAEWEEVEVLTISWTGYPCIQKQIVEAASAECLVIVFSENPSATENYLTGGACGGALDMTNVQIVDGEYDSVWIRDYGANTVYGSWNDDRVLVDWMYNRPRPDDDVIPDLLAETLGLELYSTTASPDDLMNTGGNWMSDGFGTAFASELVVDENDGGTTWWTDFPDHTAAEIDEIIQNYHGVHTYIKMPTLPYDGIHHIDMHMKLLDESTLLVSEYPEGVADGPQINANIDYVLSNFTTRWGTAFDVKRIPSPPEQGWGFPDQNGYYLTYANAVFVNNTVLLPTYYTEYDTTALRIYEELLPGYEIVGIDCDGSAEPIIAASGAIHCITHTVGVEDPLMISHLPLPDTEDTTNDYVVEAYLSHRSGVEAAQLHWTLDPDAGEWTEIPMTAVDGSEWDWTASIPAQSTGTDIFYYVEGLAVSGKTGARPMPAPAGWWTFHVGPMVAIEEVVDGYAGFSPVYPNPASAITCVPIALRGKADGRLVLRDALGREQSLLFSGRFPAGQSKYFFHAGGLAQGAYVLTLELDGLGTWSQRVMVQ
jgi:agmatine deiminase